MKRIQDLFIRKPKQVLSVYFTAGFPKLEDTLPILESLEKNGVDLVEIGIPFSDPMADGVVIQKSGAKALQNGMSLKLLFVQLEGVRERVQIPLIMMGYLNPILAFGFEAFCANCKRVGIDGLIIPDLPFKEYVEVYKPILDSYGLAMIMLITPDTSEERVRLIDRHTTGFIYMVSSAATTGVQNSFDEATQAYFNQINGMQLINPRLIGFGISNPATLSLAWDNSAGAIVGSKFIQLLEQNNTIEEAVQALLASLAIESF